MADKEFQQWHVTEPYVDLHCSLGEGPYYEKATNTLRFLDIIQQRIHTVSLSEGPGSLKTIQLDSPVGVTADIEGCDPQDKILIAVKYGIAILDRKTGKYDYLTKSVDGEGNPRLRSNDGAVDPHGRLWLGTMTDFSFGECQPEGSLLRFDLGKTRESVRTGLTIPNTIGWSPDYKTMYFTHSTAGQVLAFDYDLASGGLSNERVFYQHEGSGGPDGFRVDVEGNIWHAIYGESRVVKISTQGKVVGQVNLPTRNITCTEFVGTELFITTAADDDGEGKSKLYGGGLFRVEVGTTGVAPHSFKLGA